MANDLHLEDNKNLEHDLEQIDLFGPLGSMRDMLMAI